MKLLLLTIALATMHTAQATTVQKQIASWQFYVQLAVIQPPAGCQLTTPGIDGSNFSTATTYTLQLTDAQGHTSEVEFPADAQFESSISDGPNGIVRTTLDNPRIVTEAPDQTNVMSYVQVGALSCGTESNQK